MIRFISVGLILQIQLLHFKWSLYYIKIYISTENNPFQTFLSFSMKVTGFMKIFNFTLLCEKFLYECISWFFQIYFLGLNKIFEEFLIETFSLELYI